MRSHLSIGEVLSLLQEEFPDVTISKIRFLESQGLVDPERTPSGYRKFYEPDIERLRWVLRQQRDAFLPLKVIKGRLDGQSDLLEGTDGSPPPPPGPGEGQGSASSSAEVPSDVLEAGGALSLPTARPPARGKGSAELFDAKPPYSSYGASGAVPERPALDEQDRPEPSARLVAPSSEDVPASRARHAEGARARVFRERGRPAPGPGTFPGRQEADELSLEELVAQADVDTATVEDLERYGLVSARTVAGTSYYSGEAVAIASLAGAFARHGVEARHLRAFKAAAEREAGLVQQVIMPLIRQRNPDARQAAAEAVEELSHLGGELRAVLLRAALSELR